MSRTVPLIRVDGPAHLGKKLHPVSLLETAHPEPVVGLGKVRPQLGGPGTRFQDPLEHPDCLLLAPCAQHHVREASNRLACAPERQAERLAEGFLGLLVSPGGLRTWSEAAHSSGLRMASSQVTE